MKCKHEDGWIVKEEICINDNILDEIETEVECNKTGCGKRMIATFTIMSLKLKEIKDGEN